LRTALRTGRRTSLLLALCLGVGCRGAGFAGAETFTSAGSTTIIEQSGGRVSRSEVTRYPDGQRVITRDGRNTDITIQRSSGPRGHNAPPPSDQHAGQAPAAGRFDPPVRQDRPTWHEDDDIGPDTSDPSATAASFRERMLERMERR
jgi:hypothetical protein